MTWDVALILGVDGLANGAVYLLAGLGLVLIFSVTRVVFVPFGDVAAFAALSLAAFEGKRLPPTVGLVVLLALLATLTEVTALLRRGERTRVARALLGWGALPLLPCALAWAASGQALPHALFVALAVLLVVPITPLVARVALQPIADASVLVLLIVSLALHFLLSGLGLLFFGPEGFRTAPLAGGSLMLPGGFPLSGQVMLMLAAAVVLSGLFFLAFERTVAGKALRATCGQPRRCAAGRHPTGAHRAAGLHLCLAAGRLDRRAGGAGDDDVLRLGLPDRPEGVRRRDHRRARQLSAHRAGRARRGGGREFRLVLERRAEGRDRVQPADPGAARALGVDTPRRRGAGGERCLAAGACSAGACWRWPRRWRSRRRCWASSASRCSTTSASARWWCWGW
jgi:branched-subunit amino acid ABC-type transport system permease component